MIVVHTYSPAECHPIPIVFFLLSACLLVYRFKRIGSVNARDTIYCKAISYTSSPKLWNTKKPPPSNVDDDVTKTDDDENAFTDDDVAINGDDSNLFNDNGDLVNNDTQLHNDVADICDDVVICCNDDATVYSGSVNTFSNDTIISDGVSAPDTNSCYELKSVSVGAISFNNGTITLNDVKSNNDVNSNSLVRF